MSKKGLSSPVAVDFSIKPSSGSCVTVTSLSAPKDNTELSDINLRSSPTDKSAATPTPPLTINAPVVALDEAVVSEIVTAPPKVPPSVSNPVARLNAS